MTATTTAQCSCPDEGELQQLRLAIDASGEIIFITDSSGTFVYVNAQFVRTYGYAPSEVIGCATPRILKGNTHTEDYCAFWERLRNNHIVTCDFVNRTKAGKLLQIETSANPITDDHGQVTGFIAVQRDISERKRMEGELRESEQRYRTLAEAAHDSIFIINRDRRFAYQNEAAKARFGRSTTTTIGKGLDEVFPPETVAQMNGHLSTVFATGKRQFVEDRFSTPTGDTWLESWLVPMTEGLDVRAVMGVARDVTERKALERQFLQAQKMEAVGLLAGGIAHDFNNLLTAILGYSELLRDRLKDAPDMLADVDEIMHAGERAGRLTRQLLAFSRKQPMVRQLVDLNALVSDVQRMFGRLLGEDISLSIVADAKASEVIADPGQIEQVLLNLAVNARDAMPKGGSLTIVTADAELDEVFVHRHPDAVAGQYVSLTVRDTGFGMTEAILARVFEPFFTTKAQGKGTGLGLSTVYGIVRQSRGYITIESELDAGTSVRIFWPKPGESTGKATSPGVSIEPSLNGTETILLVEDEVGIRGLMRRTLESYGYTVLEADDVSDAIDLSTHHAGNIDLLVSDVVMPGLNGPDLAQRIVAQRSAIKVLYISGFPTSVFSARDHARLAFLGKPFGPQALVTKVRECMDG